MGRPSKYPTELRKRAVRLVLESKADYPSEYVAIRSISSKLGITSPESLRRWVRQAEVDDGARPGKTSDEIAEVKALKKENAELRRANEILKSASAFFAAELDRSTTSDPTKPSATSPPSAPRNFTTLQETSSRQPAEPPNRASGNPGAVQHRSRLGCCHITRRPRHHTTPLTVGGYLRPPPGCCPRRELALTSANRITAVIPGRTCGERTQVPGAA